MKTNKILFDLISSATGVKAHYDIWWAQMSVAKPQYARVMDKHSDFFLASQDAHYTAWFIYLAHLFDKRADSSSLPTYISLLGGSIEESKFRDIQSRFSTLAAKAAPLLRVRHKTIAHIDNRLSEKDVFQPFNMTWNEIRAIIYETVKFVEELSGAPHQGAVGIPRDGRLCEATIKLLCALE